MSEFFAETSSDGDSYVTDFANGRPLPFTFDLSTGENADDEHLIEAGETADYTLYQFLDAAGDPVNMTNQNVTITLSFADGTSETFTVTPDAPESGDLSLQSLSVTDNSDTRGSPFFREAQYNVAYTVSDPGGRFDRIEVTFESPNVPPETETGTLNRGQSATLGLSGRVAKTTQSQFASTTWTEASPTRAPLRIPPTARTRNFRLLSKCLSTSP